MDALADPVTLFECQCPELLLWGQVTELADFEVFPIEIEQNEPQTLLERIDGDSDLRLHINAVFVGKTLQVNSILSTGAQS